jgi:hypothetical protein
MEGFRRQPEDIDGQMSALLEEGMESNTVQRVVNPAWTDVTREVTREVTGIFLGSAVDYSVEVEDNYETGTDLKLWRVLECFIIFLAWTMDRGQCGNDQLDLI